LLIDGDNLLGTWPGRRRSDAERQRLAREVARLGARERRRVVIFFDGTAPPGLEPGVDVYYAGAQRSADDAMLAFLRGQEEKRGWTVVTNDRSLGDQCRWLGTRVERAHRFRGRLSGGKASEKPEREEDVDYWLEQFGDDS
jgi:hypothetical protein